MKDEEIIRRLFDINVTGNCQFDPTSGIALAPLSFHVTHIVGYGDNFICSMCKRPKKVGTLARARLPGTHHRPKTSKFSIFVCDDCLKAGRSGR